MLIFFHGVAYILILFVQNPDEMVYRNCALWPSKASKINKRARSKLQCILQKYEGIGYHICQVCCSPIPIFLLVPECFSTFTQTNLSVYSTTIKTMNFSSLGIYK